MDILFYDAPSGNAAFYSARNGNISLLESYTGWPHTWSRIVRGTFQSGAATDDLLFYDASQGKALFQGTDGAGGLVPLSMADWSNDYSSIVAGYFWRDMTCSGLLLYSEARTVAEMQSVSGRAIVSPQGQVSGFGPWTDVIPAKFIPSPIETWHNYDEPALTRIEGYASADSVAPGQTIDLCVESERIIRGQHSFQFAVSLARSGISDFTFEATGDGRPQETPQDAASLGCGWQSAVTVLIPPDCRSGLYLATISSGSISAEISFVVRPGTASAGILLEIATATIQAYNPWGGQSLYSGTPDGSTRGHTVSYDRPDMTAQRGGILSTDLINWLEVNNELTIDYCTSVDLHLSTIDLNAYSVLLAHWHDEYWSLEMRSNVESFLSQGGNVVILAANTCWWQIRFDDTARRITCYKYIDDDPATRATADPFATSGDPDQLKRTTVYWWDDPVDRPEICFIGVTFRYGWAVARDQPPKPAGYTVARIDSFAFNGLGIAVGDVFGLDTGIIGGEVDSALGQYPNGTKFGNQYWSLSYTNSPRGFVELAYCDLYIVPDWDGNNPSVPLVVLSATGNTVTVSTVAGYTSGFLVQGSLHSQITSVNTSQSELVLADARAWEIGQPAIVSQSYGWASMGIFQFQNSGLVFNAGTIRWTVGLDPLNQAVVSIITINVLRGLRDIGLLSGNQSIIQETSGDPNQPGNFEALLLRDNGLVTYLVHYSRNNSNPALPWRTIGVLSSSATASAGLVESTYRPDPTVTGDFHTLVLERDQLVHYWRDNSNPAKPWNRGAVVSPVYPNLGPVGAACLIESSYKTDPNQPGSNLEALVLEGTSGSPPYSLMHYWKDNNSDPTHGWNRGELVSSTATGPACLIQSSSGNFQALVLEGNQIVRYWRDNTDPATPWHRAEVVSTAATGPACLIESTFGNFEALVLENRNLVHYWRSNSDATGSWARTVTVSSAATSPAALIESSFKTDPTKPGNFEVLVQEAIEYNKNILVAYWRDNSDAVQPWYKGYAV
jgi:hypothetical protein